MDEVLRGVLLELGYDLGICVIDSIANADDLVLFADNPARLQEQLISAQKLFARAGMTINTQKSISLPLAASASQASCPVMEAFTVPLKSSYCKPDLLVIADGVVYVIDMTVMSGYRLKESWDLEIAKYSIPEISDAIIDVLGKRNVVVNEVAHLSFVMSFKGFLLPDSADGLKRLQLGRFCLRALEILAMCRSLACYDAHTRGFSSSSGLKRHFVGHKRNSTANLAHLINATGFKCIDCVAQFNSQSGLSKHRRRAHPAEYSDEKFASTPKSQ
ncbi:hypothetical protein PHET_09357 [Paragonimus heterotremus]|uniref:C2H2-type domain-containing protein n=1 Tax=Paragonimus heterotremus TaxID=100268 RepID=A0A8J4T9W3_9TREM|nr:hypothetical protein PHET_09357 [Paragonimus heterotremus]